MTAGYGAENADVPGGVVNMASKSGSNRWEIDVRGWAEDSRLRFGKTPAYDSTARILNYYINPAVGGPIIKDRLWFYLNTESRIEYNGRQPDPSGVTYVPHPSAGRYWNARAALKLTWQIAPRAKLSSYSNVNSDYGMNGAAPILMRTDDAQMRRDDADFFHGFIFEGLLGDALLLRSQVGYRQEHARFFPMLCDRDPAGCELTPQTRLVQDGVTVYGDNYELQEQNINRSLEVINQLEWFGRLRRLGEHHLKLRSRFYAQMFELAQSTPGNYYDQLRNGQPDIRVSFFSNDPRVDGVERSGYFLRETSGLTTIHSLSDSFNATAHLVINAGLAFTTASAGNQGRGGVLDAAALTPHLSAIWDATGDGKTVLRGSFNQYVDSDALRLARLFVASRVSRQCAWNAASGTFDAGCFYGGGDAGRTVGLPCGPDGTRPDGTSCRETLGLPRTWEYTLGAEREVLPGVGLGADLVFRRYTHPYEDRETNRVWLPSGYGLERTGEFRNGRSQTVTDLGTPGSAGRRYVGVTAALHKHQGPLKASIAYTWSKLEGNVNNNESNAFGVTPARDLYYLWGFLPDDARHVLNASVVKQWTRWFGAGLVYRYTSGKPYSRLFRNDVTAAFDDHRARVGTSAGANVNDPADDRAQRLPDVHMFNVQLRFGLLPLVGFNLEGTVDAINLLALRTPVAVQQNDGPAFGQVTTVTPPLYLRLGFRFRY
jgi:hypothetical protein